MHQTYQLETRILRQVTYYPQFRKVAAQVLKPSLFLGKCGKVGHAELFAYIVNGEADFIEIIHHFAPQQIEKGLLPANEVLLMLMEEDLPEIATISPLLFFVFLERRIRDMLEQIVGRMEADHFREECLVLLRSDTDFFETIDTMYHFLSHYNHPSAVALEEIRLSLDERIRKIKATSKAALLIRQAGELLKLKHHNEIINPLTEALLALC